MFLGNYDYKIDEKGRVPLPPRFRPDFKDGVVLAPGPEKYILVYTSAQWEKISENLASSSGNIQNSKMRRLNRALFATAFLLNIDAQGRISLPAPLRQHAGISEDVVIAGANTYLEIWSKQSWEKEQTESQDQVWQIIESMEKR